MNQKPRSRHRRTRDRWRRSPALLLALVVIGITPSTALAQTTYLAFGDSITAGTGDNEERDEKGYPPRLEEMLNDSGREAVVENHGVPGERTPAAVARIDEVLGGGGDVLLLMEGTNDVEFGISPETTRFNLDEIAGQAEAAGLSVAHATVIPRRPGNGGADTEKRVATQRLAHAVRDLAGTAGRALADPYEVFVTTPDVFSCCYADLADDGVGHPNAEGYDLLAQVFFDVLVDRDTVPPVSGGMEPSPGAELAESPEEIVLEVWDFGDGIDLTATELLVDGEPVSAVLFGDARHVTLTYAPNSELSGAVAVGLRSSDLATPANRVDRDLATFSVGSSSGSADIDGDGRVDGRDLVRLGLAFGAVRGDDRFDAAADLDASGAIDGVDLAILADAFGSTVG